MLGSVLDFGRFMKVAPSVDVPVIRPFEILKSDTDKSQSFSINNPGKYVIWTLLYMRYSPSPRGTVGRLLVRGCEYKEVLGQSVLCKLSIHTIQGHTLIGTVQYSTSFPACDKSGELDRDKPQPALITNSSPLPSFGPTFGFRRE